MITSRRKERKIWGIIRFATILKSSSQREREREGERTIEIHPWKEDLGGEKAATPHLSKNVALWEGLAGPQARESAGRCGQPWCGVGGTAVGPRISQGSGLHSSSLFQRLLSSLHSSNFVKVVPPPPPLFCVSFTGRKEGSTSSSPSDIRYVRSGNASMSCLRKPAVAWHSR